MDKNKQYLIPRTQTMEVKIDNTSGSSFTFGDSTTLRQHKLTGIRVRMQNEAGTKKSLTGRTLVSRAGMDCAHITLSFGGVNVIDKAPIELFTKDENDDNFSQICIPKGFDPQRSKIQFSDMANVSAGQSVELVFIYEGQYCNEVSNC